MINTLRIVEILHNGIEEDLLRAEGEMMAYEEFSATIKAEDPIEKVYDYLSDERQLANISIDDIDTEYEDWNRLMGRKRAYDKIEKALIDHGE